MSRTNRTGGTQFATEQRAARTANLRLTAGGIARFYSAVGEALSDRSPRRGGSTLDTRFVGASAHETQGAGFFRAARAAANPADPEEPHNAILSGNLSV